MAAQAGPGGRGLVFPYAQQAIRITRTRTTRTGGKTKRGTETAYAGTSLTALDATASRSPTWYAVTGESRTDCTTCVM